MKSTVKEKLVKQYIFEALFSILGFLPGSTFSVNSHGLVLTGNIVIPTKVYMKERLGKEYTFGIHFLSHRLESGATLLVTMVHIRFFGCPWTSAKQSYFQNFIRFQKF